MMSSGEARRVTAQDLQLVQNLIERCLQLYMNQKEVVATLLNQAKIEPSFTILVWQKLEEQNHEFFKAYHLRLKVKQQIIIFNELLHKQVELMQKISPPVHQNSLCHSPHIQPGSGPGPVRGKVMNIEEMQQQQNSSNMGSLFGEEEHMQQEMHIPSSGRGMDARAELLPPQDSGITSMHGINGGMIKPEAGYVGPSTFMIGPDGSFNTVDPNHIHPLGETILDPDTSSFGFLGQIPRNFSLSDLTADFSQSSDILESYSRSPFMGQPGADRDHFLDDHHHHHHHHHGPGGGGGGMSKGSSSAYDDFESD